MSSAEAQPPPLALPCPTACREKVLHAPAATEATAAEARDATVGGMRAAGDAQQRLPGRRTLKGCHTCVRLLPPACLPVAPACCPLLLSPEALSPSSTPPLLHSRSLPPSRSPPGQEIEGTARAATDKAEGAYEQARDTAGSAADAAAAKLDAAKRAVTEGAGRAADTARDTAGRAGDAAREAAGRAEARAGEAGGGARGLHEKHEGAKAAAFAGGD